MPDARTGLSPRKGKCAGKPCGISQIQPELVFRGAHHECSHNPNEISALGAELVFRELPGELIQRRGHVQWFWSGLCLRRPLVNPPRDGVARVPAVPTGLRLLTSRRLAVGLPAGVLAVSYARVRPEPPTANRTRSLPGLWHGDASWSPRIGRPVACQFRMPGSVLESTGGSILASAEGIGRDR